MRSLSGLWMLVGAALASAQTADMAPSPVHEKWDAARAFDRRYETEWLPTYAKLNEPTAARALAAADLAQELAKQAGHIQIEIRLFPEDVALGITARRIVGALAGVDEADHERVAREHLRRYNTLSALCGWNKQLQSKTLAEGWAYYAHDASTFTQRADDLIGSLQFFAQHHQARAQFSFWGVVDPLVWTLAKHTDDTWTDLQDLESSMRTISRTLTLLADSARQLHAQLAADSGR